MVNGIEIVMFKYLDLVVSIEIYFGIFETAFLYMAMTVLSMLALNSQQSSWFRLQSVEIIFLLFPSTHLVILMAMKQYLIFAFK